jgi:hypothetical protein
MGTRPLLGLVAVEARADDVEQEDDGGDGENGALGLELIEGVALVQLPPCRVGSVGGSGSSAAESGGVGRGLGNRVRSASKVGKVCDGEALARGAIQLHAMRQSTSRAGEERESKGRGRRTRVGLRHRLLGLGASEEVFQEVGHG